MELLENMDVQIRRYTYGYPAHYEVEYIKHPKEREKYLEQDVWDMRKLFKDYPKHHPPIQFIIKFTKIENIHLRKIVKQMFCKYTWNLGTKNVQNKFGFY